MKSTKEMLREKAASLGIDSQFVSKHFGDSRKNQNWELAIKQRLEARAQGIETVEETIETVEETIVNDIISGDLELNKKDSLEALGESLAALPSKESIDTELSKIHPWIQSKASKTSLKKDCISLYKAIESHLGEYDKDALDSLYMGKYPKHHAVCIVQSWANDAKQEEEQKPVSDTPTKAIRLDAQKYIDEAIKLLDSNDWREIVIGVGFLTGKRPNEICLITQWQPRDTYSITYQGISKKPELDNKVIGACLYDSEKIVDAVYKLRKIHQFPSVYQVFLETGNIIEARKKFNSSFGSGTNGLSDVFRKKFPELCDDENAFRKVRDFYVCVNFTMFEDKFDAVTSDCLNFAKTVVNHENTDSSLKYDAFKFNSLPLGNYPESYFQLSSYKLEPDEKEKKVKMIEFNILEIVEKTAIANRESVFMQLYAKHQDVAKAILEMDEMLANRASVTPRNDSQPYERTVKVLNAILEYNKLLMANNSIPELDKNYVGVSRSMLTTISGHIAGKQPSPVMAQDVIDRHQDKIDEINNPWMISSDPKGMKRANLHFRKNRSGITESFDRMIADIKKIYDAM